MHKTCFWLEPRQEAYINKWSWKSPGMAYKWLKTIKGIQIIQSVSLSTQPASEPGSCLPKTNWGRADEVQVDNRISWTFQRIATIASKGQRLKRKRLCYTILPIKCSGHKGHRKDESCFIKKKARHFSIRLICSIDEAWARTWLWLPRSTALNCMFDASCTSLAAARGYSLKALNWLSWHSQGHMQHSKWSI